MKRKVFNHNEVSNDEESNPSSFDKKCKFENSSIEFKNEKNIISCFQLLDTGSIQDGSRAENICLNLLEMNQSEEENDDLFLEYIALGLNYYFGWRILEDYTLRNEKAILYFNQYIDKFKQKAKDEEIKQNNCTLACYVYFYLANIYLDFLKDPIKAVDYYSEAIKYGNVESLYKLSYIYRFGDVNVECDIKKSLELLVKASEMNHPNACYLLGSFYETGSFVEINITTAISLYAKSSKLGNYFGSFVLGKIFEEGKKTEKHYEKATFFFLKAYHQANSLFDRSTIEIQLKSLMETRRVAWKSDYHLFWRSSAFLDKQIVTLLLVHKFRYSSSFVGTKYVARVVLMNIIKFLCHFQ